jgi:5'-nucleotidase / UDP-sugar diphosphatase
MKAAIRRPMVLFFSLAMLVSFAPDLQAAEKILTILHVNDSHSHLESFGPKNRDLEGSLGGIAKVATVINAETQSAPDAPLLLHAGDIFTGDIFFNAHGGVPELQLLADMGFDAMTLGDHELDLGPAGLLSALEAAFPPIGNPLAIPLPFKILAANLDDSAWCGVGVLACNEKQIPDSPDLVVKEPIILDSTIVERPGTINRPLKIGIFGMTFPGNPAIQSADKIASIALATANSLRTRGADLVICLSHLGIDTDRMIAQNYASVIDIIVGGHDHEALMQPISISNSTGGKTLIVQAGEFYKYVGKLLVSVNIPDTGSGPVTVALKNYKLIPVDASISADPAIQNRVNFFKAGIYAEYGDVYGSRISTAPRAGIDNVYNPNRPFKDTGAGNLVTDAFRKHTNADIAITANGFISEKLHGGAIVPADVMRMVPYGADPATGQGFNLVNVRLTGEQIMKGIEYSLRATTPYEHGLQVSGMRFTYDPTRPDGDRLVPRTVRMGRRLINARAVYTVTMNEGMVTLMEGQMGIIPESPPAVMPDSEYTVLKDYISDRKVVRSQSQGRIREKKVLMRVR